ncbi:WD40-repeat-containing domain protein [Cladochytrium replicatum]|nr:WD40-repeat-containing domain protein [Cladochytrium replicatum]
MKPKPKPPRPPYAGGKVPRTQDKKLQGLLKKTKEQLKDAKDKAEQAELLLPQDQGYLIAEGTERTYSFSQRKIGEAVDVNTRSKTFDLTLDFGPYRMDYTRNGRHVVVGGKKGHIAAFDWKSNRLRCEVQVQETVRDVKWLHNEKLFAVAQKEFTYIYDNNGVEVHCLRQFKEAQCLEFLPHHFLLASVNSGGILGYQDTSTGHHVAAIRTKLGLCDTMTVNPYNAIVHLGHSNGTVTLWSPNSTEPLVKMLCHKGPVKAVAVDTAGNYMCTAGLDGRLKVWDVRSYKPLHEYVTPTPATSLAISQMGFLAVGWSGRVTIWKDPFRTKQRAPYMAHAQDGLPVEDLNFCPYEDILGLSYSKGIRSLIVPGSGEPNFDTLEANPYQTKTQQRENEVQMLLQKIQPEMISLNPDFVGTVDKNAAEVEKEAARFEMEANMKKLGPAAVKYKMRGRSAAKKRYEIKQRGIISAKSLRREALIPSKKGLDLPSANKTALSRFKKRQA